MFIKDSNHKRRLVAIFQPHRFSRVKQFIHEFAFELSKADVIYLTNIFGAGEKNIYNIDSTQIVDLIYKTNKNVEYIKNNFEIKNSYS